VERTIDSHKEQPRTYASRAKNQKKDVRPKIRENRAQNLSSVWPKEERSVWRLRDKPFADSNHITLLPSQDEGKNHSSGEAAVRPAFQCLLTAVRIKSIIRFPFVRINKNKQRQSKSNNEGKANGIELTECACAAIGGLGEGGRIVHGSPNIYRRSWPWWAGVTGPNWVHLLPY
jgi:hypothetical protein